MSLGTAKNRVDWDIPDPKNMEKDEFKKVRDLIETKVKELLKRINTNISYAALVFS